MFQSSEILVEMLETAESFVVCALDFVTTPRVRGIAAPTGRTFALELATVGLWVRAPSAFGTRIRSPALHAVH